MHISGKDTFFALFQCNSSRIHSGFYILNDQCGVGKDNCLYIIIKCITFSIVSYDSKRCWRHYIIFFFKLYYKFIHCSVTAR